MTAFLCGVLSGIFLMMFVLQLATKKSITFGYIKDKSEDLQLFWSLTLSYFSGSLSGVIFYMVSL
jgi:hypothetical protein